MGRGGGGGRFFGCGMKERRVDSRRVSEDERDEALGSSS